MAEEENHVFETNEEISENTDKKKSKKTVLENFSKIKDKQSNVRVKSGAILLEYLSQIGDEKGEEIKHALTRLVRGLGASTASARTGFYTTLVGLLNVRDDIDAATVLDIAAKHLHSTSSNSKGENGDISIGQVLLCGAIIKSNLFQKSDEGDQKRVLNFLLLGGSEKTYLKLPTYSFIVDLLEILPEASFKKIVFPFIKPEIVKKMPEHTLDTLYLLLKVKEKYPALLKSTDTVIENDLTELSNVLMTIPRITAIRHPIYIVVSNYLATKSKKLPDFFNEIDAHLQKPNRNKFLVITQLFSILLQTIKDKSVIQHLLTRNFIQRLLNNFKLIKIKQKDPEFVHTTQNFFTQLVGSLKDESVKSDTKINVLKKLQITPGTFIFEKITRTKTIQQIIALLDKDGVKALAKIYADVVYGTHLDNSDDWFNNDRLYAAHLLIKLLNHPAVRDDIAFRVEQMTFLMKLSLLKDEKIGCELSASLKTAFYNALDMKLSKLEDLQAVLLKLVHNLNDILASENSATLFRTPLSDEEHELWQKTMKLVEKIEKKKKNKLRSVFLTLFLNIGLQLFNNNKLAADALNELFKCYKKTKKHDHDDTVCESEENETQDPLWIEVVIDLFLNFLSHNSHLLRSLVKCVFPHLCQYMNGTAVHQLLSVFDVKNDTNLLQNEGDSSDEEDSEADEKDEEDGDEQSATDDEEEEDEEEDDEEEEMEGETVNEKMRMALHKALMENGYGSDQESVDLDQLSDSEGDKLNEALAGVFKQFKPNRGRNKKQTKDQETLMHFRVRILDLIEIYLDSSPPMLLVLEIMLPLLQTVEYSIRDDHQRPLFTRLKSCLKRLSSLKKFSDMNDVNGELLNDLLNSFLDRGSKNALIIQEMGEQITDCCLFVVKCSQMLVTNEATPKKVKKQLKKAIGEIILNSLETYFSKRDCLTPYVLFKNILQINWSETVGIVKQLFSYIFNQEIKPFKRAQGTELLKIFYSNHRCVENQLDLIQKSMVDVHEAFSSQVVTFFNDAVDARNVKERFVCNLLLLLGNIKNSKFNTNIEWEKIGNSVREYRSTVTLSKDTKKAYNKLCSSLGISNVVQMKTNVSKLNGSAKKDVSEEQSGKKEKKKRQKSKTANKLKKESKALRLQSLSEGFVNGVGFEEAENMDMDDLSDLENVDIIPKKRKTDQVNGIHKKKIRV